MRGGKLRHRITLQSPTRTTNADGQVEQTYATVATVSANVTINSTGEAGEHRQQRGFWTATVVIRYSPTVAAIQQDWRFTFNGTTWNVISAVDETGEREEIVIDAEARPGLS